MNDPSIKLSANSSSLLWRPFGLYKFVGNHSPSSTSRQGVIYAHVDLAVLRSSDCILTFVPCSVCCEAGTGSERGFPLCADLIVTVLFLEGISGASYYEGSFSNIRRAADGSYVAVSSRGNFFLTWSPGQSNWQPHNRPQ